MYSLLLQTYVDVLYLTFIVAFAFAFAFAFAVAVAVVVGILDIVVTVVVEGDGDNIFVDSLLIIDNVLSELIGW